MPELASPVDPYQLADTPRRRQILDGLRFLGAGPAEFYLDALRILASPEALYTSNHLIFHCLREIESSVRGVLNPVDWVRPVQGAYIVSVQLALTELGIDEQDPLAKLWLSVARESPLHASTHRNSLLPARRVDSETLVVFEQMETLFEGVLAASEAHYAVLLPKLIELASKTIPTKKDLKFVRQTMPKNPVTLGHFFDVLHHPGWLRKLDEAGMFAHPPPLIPVEDDKVRVPPWPEGRYLAEMAAADPDTVLEITKRLPPSNNPRVYEGICSIALALPGPAAATLVPALTVGLSLRLQISLADSIAAVVAHLTEKDCTKAALELATQLLRILPVPGGDTPKFRLNSTRSIMDDWSYGQAVAKVRPGLTTGDGPGTIQLLITLLETAVERARPAAAQLDQDYSETWRSEISSEQDEHMDIPNILVSALTASAQELVRDQPGTITEVVGALDSARFMVFRRVLLEVARGTRGGSLAADLLARGSLFEGWSPEYQKLLRESFAGLPETVQDQVLTFVERGPDLERLGRWLRGPADTDPSPEVLQGAADAWRGGRLDVLGAPIPARWQERLGHIPVATPAPELVFGLRRIVWTGDDLKAEAIDLAHLDRPGLLAYLGGLTGADRWDGRLADVSTALTRQVAGAPSWPGVLDDEFAQVRPDLLEAIVSGWSAAYDEGKAIPWPQILRSSAWVLRPTSAASGHVPTEFSRKSILWLLEKAFQNSERSVPPDQADVAWAIISPPPGGPQDPDPEETWADTDYPIGTASLNSVRAVAINTAIEYARWLRRNSPDPASITALPPEVAAFLDSQLEASQPSGSAVRESFGRFFHILWQLDPAWTGERVPRIFDDTDAGRGAWRVYLAFWRPVREIFPHLRHLYARSIDDLLQPDPSTTNSADRGRDLAEHMIIRRVWPGFEDEDEDTALVDRFFEVATVELRQHALEYPGFALSQEGAAVPPPIMIERLQSVWEAREASCSAAKDVGAAAELRAFGYWFTSNAFPLEWSMQHLARAVDLAGRIDNERRVVDHLADLSDAYLGAALRILSQLTASDDEGWTILSWAEGGRALVRRGRESTDQAVRAQATALLGRLLQRGYNNYRDLAE